MKHTFAFLALCLIISIELSGQQIPNPPKPLNPFAGKKTAPALKSTSTIKQKMDSSHVQRYNNEIGGLRTINRDRYAFDSKGRLALAVSYTCNTWDDLYHWFKDTSAYDNFDKLSLQASYTRVLETDPWMIQNYYETYRDAHGNDTLGIGKYPAGENGELLTVKTVGVYDSDNRMLSAITSHQDTTTGEWILESKYEPTFDSEGNTLTESMAIWSSEKGNWIPYIYYENTYDAADLPVLNVGYFWSDSDQKWIGLYRNESTYDSKGNLTQYLTFAWNDETSQWTGVTKQTSTYDSKSNLTEAVSYFWSTETSQWQPGTKETDIYDSKSNLTESLNYSWSVDNSQWVPQSRTTNTFDSGDRNIISSYFRWDTGTAAWIESSRNEKDFDNAGNLTAGRLYSSKDSTGQWKSKYKFVYTYNNAFSVEEILTPYGWTGEVPVHMFLSAVGTRLDNTTGTWYTTTLQNYYYSEFAGSSIPETINATAIRVFPNPASDHLFIDLSQPSEPASFVLRDIGGRSVISATLSGSRNLIPINQLPAGIYLYQVIQKGEVQSGKVVVRR